jgi:hypothetical protein
MFYAFSNTTSWWRYLASRLDFATETVLVSDISQADIDISAVFHRNLALPRVGIEAVDALGKEACDEVIARCRLLRVLEPDLALRMVGAMWKTIEEVLDRERPDLFVSFVVDRYILDLFERALGRRSVRYVGLAVGVLPETFMFMARGEYLPVREPTDSEVDAAVATLGQADFVPNYVARPDFGLGRFVRLYVRFTARWLLFEVLRLIKRRPYDFRYLSSRWAECGLRVRLKDWRVMSFLDRNWQRALDAAPFDRRVFVALSVNPEAAIEYWVPDTSMIDHRTVLEHVATKLEAAGFHLFVKDHPSQFGFREAALFDALAKHSAVTFVPYEVPGQSLIQQCHTTFTWTGTVGLQAALAGRCAIVDANAYYVVDGLFLVVKEQADFEDLPRRISEFAPALPLPEARRVLARHMLRSTVPGDQQSWRRFTPRNPDCVKRVETVVTSLNRYLPTLAGMT